MPGLVGSTTAGLRQLGLAAAEESVEGKSIAAARRWIAEELVSYKIVDVRWLRFPSAVVAEGNISAARCWGWEPHFDVDEQQLELCYSATWYRESDTVDIVAEE
jgi:hypothetical protein